MMICGERAGERAAAARLGAETLARAPPVERIHNSYVGIDYLHFPLAKTAEQLLLLRQA